VIDPREGLTSMAFWTAVSIVYVALLGIGLAIGRHFARRRSPGGGLGRGADLPTPSPTPSFGLACPPLGSEFDRALLPGAFSAPDVIRLG
jgi:hypothetical protein